MATISIAQVESIDSARAAVCRRTAEGRGRVGGENGAGMVAAQLQNAYLLIADLQKDVFEESHQKGQWRVAAIIGWAVVFVIAALGLVRF